MQDIADSFLSLTFLVHITELDDLLEELNAMEYHSFGLETREQDGEMVLDVTVLDIEDYNELVSLLEMMRDKNLSVEVLLFGMGYDTYTRLYLEAEYQGCEVLAFSDHVYLVGELDDVDDVFSCLDKAQKEEEEDAVAA